MDNQNKNHLSKSKRGNVAVRCGRTPADTEGWMNAGDLGDVVKRGRGTALGSGGKARQCLPCQPNWNLLAGLTELLTAGEFYYNNCKGIFKMFP